VATGHEENSSSKWAGTHAGKLGDYREAVGAIMSVVTERAKKRSRFLNFAIALTAGAMMGAISVSPAQAAKTTTTYQVSTAIIANPERGLYQHPGSCDSHDLNAGQLKELRVTQKITLVLCIYYLESFRDRDLSGATLDHLARQARAVRDAGMKMVLRFAYADSQDEPDAPLAVVRRHLDQLAPFFRANQDVIDVVESGFVGAWGEGAYSTNFGNSDSENWAARKAVIEKLLGVLPPDRMALLRTPRMKRTMYGTAPVTAAQAYRGSALARLGHHNDCFLASASDYGTYRDPAVEYPYLAADTTYVAMGGETCKLNRPRSDCPTAVAEMTKFHYSYLNGVRLREVLDVWRTQGCWNPINRRLGYRYALLDATFPASVARSGTLSIKLRVQNSGFATAHNPRPVYLVLRNRTTGALVKIRVGSDPRRWSPGTTTISQDVRMPAAMSPGTYDLLLSMPDPISTLSTNPAFAIQLANVGTWEAGTGFNRLLTSVSVT
jgi:hypothetical protein